MKKRTLYVMTLGTLAMAMTFFGCSKNNDINNEKPAPTIDSMDADTRAVFEASRDMTYPFFKEVNNNVNPNENFMISPLSLTEVLAMLANGANGETQKQILKVMNVGTLEPTLACQALKTLNSFLPSADKDTKVAIANSQWIDDELKVKDAYVKNNEETLSAETFNQDLSTTKTMNDINSWCDKNTNGCIKKLFNEPLSADAKMVLINALYFKGLWKEKFNKDFTQDEEFTNFDGSKTKVKMMHQAMEFLACLEEKFDMAEFPYGNGSFCMDVILPHEDVTLDECLKEINKAKMEECFNAMNYSQVILGMPRMELNYKRRLNEDLKALGMKDAFNLAIADFSGMSDTKLFLSVVEQITSLKVDEEGTVAAAVTDAVEKDTALPPSESLYFVMNRPFAFLIREKKTGVVLFMGRMVKF